MLSNQKIVKQPLGVSFLFKTHSIIQAAINRKAIALHLLMIIFYIDFIIPQETAVGILYVFALMVIEKESPKTIIYFASLASLLIFGEAIYHHRDEIHYIFYFDRILSLAAIWIACNKMLMIGKLNTESILVRTEKIKQETKYLNLIDNLIEGAQIIDKNWKYVYVNDVTVKQSKYKKEDLLGFTIMEKYPGIENTEMFLALKECLASGKPKIIENEFAYPDGSKGWFQLSIQPVEEGLFILSKDVTELKKTMESLIKARVAKDYTARLRLYKEESIESLRYAESIQKALMPSELYFTKTLRRLQK